MLKELVAVESELVLGGRESDDGWSLNRVYSCITAFVDVVTINSAPGGFGASAALVASSTETFGAGAVAGYALGTFTLGATAAAIHDLGPSGQACVKPTRADRN